MEKDNILANMDTMSIEKEKSENCISLLKMVIQMKTKEVVEEKIMPKGDENLFEWQRSLQFKAEMISVAEDGLKETMRNFKEEQEKNYEFLKGLHTDSQTSGQGKGVVGVSLMQNNFSSYLDNLIEKSTNYQNKVSDLQQLMGIYMWKWRKYNNG